jgi:hypothetical protein
VVLFGCDLSDVAPPGDWRMRGTPQVIVIAITGFLGFGYVVLHVLGDLLVFGGPARLNA